MKRRSMLVGIVVLLLGTVANSNATPLYYTFMGTVSSTVGATGDLVTGSSVSYTFLVDFELQGSVTIDNSTSILSDSAETDFFYVEYVSGTVLLRPDTGTNSFSYNYGTDSLQYGGEISGSPSDFSSNNVFVQSGSLASSWTGGISAIGHDWVQVDGYYTRVYSLLTLTDISSSAPATSVPEPSTMLLLSSGLLGLVGLNRRRKA